MKSPEDLIVEAHVVDELRIVAGNPALTSDDIFEWSTGDIEEMAGETIYYLPKSRITVGLFLKKGESNVQGA